MYPYRYGSTGDAQRATRSFGVDGDWEGDNDMLVVKVEVWPGGDDDGAFEISRIGLANMTNLAEFSNYELTALLNRDSKERSYRGEVNQHDRSLGWVPLVRRALTDIHLNADEAPEIPYDDPVTRLLRKGSYEQRTG